MTKAAPIHTLRRVALVAVIVGGLASEVLMLLTGTRQRPVLIIILFTGWVLAPFVATALASFISKRWSVITQGTLYVLMLILTVASLAIYVNDFLHPPKSTAAFVWVAVPMVSGLVILVVLATAALISRLRARRDAAAS
jgi:hypothetical protein